MILSATGKWGSNFRRIERGAHAPARPTVQKRGKGRDHQRCRAMFCAARLSNPRARRCRLRASAANACANNGLNGPVPAGTRAEAQRKAVDGWSAAAVAAHGEGFSKWTIAGIARVGCTLTPEGHRCRAAASPCRDLNEDAEPPKAVSVDGPGWAGPLENANGVTRHGMARRSCHHRDRVRTARPVPSWKC